MESVKSSSPLSVLVGKHSSVRGPGACTGPAPGTGVPCMAPRLFSAHGDPKAEQDNYEKRFTPPQHLDHQCSILRPLRIRLAVPHRGWNLVKSSEWGGFPTSITGKLKKKMETGNVRGNWAKNYPLLRKVLDAAHAEVTFIFYFQSWESKSSACNFNSSAETKQGKGS